MQTISFYRQQRQDEAIRTGLAADGATLLQHFDEGAAESDPALLWYVDVRAEGRGLPRDGEAVRVWFQEHADVIRQALRNLANELRAGIDVDAWPLQAPVAGAPRGVKLEIVCSAVRRLQALQIADRLLDIAEHWDEYLSLLDPYEPVRR
jgi:hypothetical protein